MQDLKDYLIKNNLELDIEDVKLKWKCGICKELLCNTKTSKCGCSFCQNCIETYLMNKENKTCLNCSKEFEFGMALSVDYRKDIKIQSLVIKCPNSICKEEVNLGDMLDHLKSCSNERVNCVFDRLGCSITGNSNLEMNAHVNSELGQHLSLIVERLNRDEDNKVEQNQILLQRMQRMEESLENISRTLVTITQNISENSAKQSETIEKVSETTQKISENSLKYDELSKKVSEISEDQSTIFSNVKSRLNQIIVEGVQPRLPRKHCIFSQMSSIDIKRRYMTDSFQLESYTFSIEMSFKNDGYNLEFLVFLIPSYKDKYLIWPLQRDIKLEILMANGIDRKFHIFGYNSAAPTSKIFYERPTKEVFFRESRMRVNYDDVVSDYDNVNVILTLFDINYIL